MESLLLYVDYHSASFTPGIERLRAYCFTLVCLSVCPSDLNLTCKPNISLLLQNYLSLCEGYFQQYAPNKAHGSKVKVINLFPNNKF